MLLQVVRYSSQKDDTLGLLFDYTDERTFLCFTLEDEARTKKKWGETRIPAGKYRIELRTEGGFHARYKKRFPSLHKGMLWVKDVPGFEYILIHIGNDDDDTAGCLLVGNEVRQNITSSGKLLHSTDAYRRIYPLIVDKLLAGEEVWIIYADLDDPKEAP